MPSFECYKSTIMIIIAIGWVIMSLHKVVQDIIISVNLLVNNKDTIIIYICRLLLSDNVKNDF